LYFWTFVVAIIFGIGAGFSLYDGTMGIIAYQKYRYIVPEFITTLCELAAKA
jgi:hypothetical protein